MLIVEKFAMSIDVKKEWKIIHGSLVVTNHCNHDLVAEVLSVKIFIAQKDTHITMYIVLGQKEEGCLSAI